MGSLLPITDPPNLQSSCRCQGSQPVEQPRDFQRGYHHLQPYPVYRHSPPSPSPFPQVIGKEHKTRKLHKRKGYEHEQM